MNQVPELPKSDDTYWDDAEQIKHKPMQISLCATHSKENWLNHDGYRQEADGTIVCTMCPWGGRAPGYYKVENGKIVDLRTL